jgi:phosphoribosylformylglycinamidine cyclo-ligase
MTVVPAAGGGRQRQAGPSYAGAGVDIEAGSAAVDLMRVRGRPYRAARGHRRVSAGSPGCSTRPGSASYRRPLLATSTDGVGTKVAIAQPARQVYDTIGIDLVGHGRGRPGGLRGRAAVHDRLRGLRARPAERVAAIVSGVADGCAQAGCALLGGETAEHPGHFGPDDFDLAGAATGVVEADQLLGPDRVRPGDVVIAMASSGLHSNGFSLVRIVIDRRATAGPRRRAGRARPPLGEELLTPTRIYARDCLALAGSCDVHAFAHVTGGGLAANLARVLPPGTDAVLDRGTWQPATGVRLLADAAGWRGRWSGSSTWASGMVAVVAPATRTVRWPAGRPGSAVLGTRRKDRRRDR